MTPLNALPRRKRFQFSLRTLMIVVLVYGGLWLLTIKWGANQLARELAAEYSEEVEQSESKWMKDGHIEFRGTGNFFTPASGGIPTPTPFTINLSVVSRFPFVLHDEEKFVINDRDVGGPTHDYLWFLGARLKLR